MVMDAFVHIHEERYYSALNTVDQINQRLDAMDSAKFASQLRRWMPSLTEMINKATKEEVLCPGRRPAGTRAAAPPCDGLGVSEMARAA